MSRKKSINTDLMKRILHLVDINSSGNNALFAKKAGIPNSTFHEYIKGRAPHIDHVIRICETFDVNSNWLLFGEGEMIRSGAPGAAPKAQSPDVLTAHRDIVAQFMDAPRAMDANMRLLEIERADPVLFREICAYIKGVVNGIGRRVNGAKDYARNPTPDVPEKKVANGKG
jgi:hypothetical protein